MNMDFFSDADKDRVEQVMLVIESGRITSDEIKQLIYELLYIAHLDGKLAAMELVGGLEQAMERCQKTIRFLETTVAEYDDENHTS